MSKSDPEAQLILLSAATVAARERSQAAFLALAESVDWSRLEAMLSVRRLLPLLGGRMLSAAGDRAPRSFAEAVERATVDARRHGQFLELAGMRVTETLSNAGIASLVLKGPALGRRLHGDLGHRLSSDIDLLVLPGELKGAVDAVAGLGYGHPTDPVGADGLPLLHFTMSHGEQLLPDVELHWRLHWYEREFASEMLNRSSAGPDGERSPTPIDGFIGLLLFYARDGFVDVRLVVDLVAWWEASRLDLRPRALGDALRRYPALRRAVLGALAAAESVAGLPAQELLDESERRDLRARLAARLANPNPTQSLTQLHADMALVDGMLAPAGAQREFIRRQLLISRDVLEYRAKRARRDRVGSSVGHGGRVLARNVLAMGRLLRGARA